MKFISYGNRNNKSILFIHGLASTADLCFKPLLPYLQDYFVIFCELDGHYGSNPKDLTSMEETIDSIESYILNQMGGSVYGLCGFSMGATIAVELIAIGNISASKVLLDAAITAELGLKARPFTCAFIIGTSRIKNKKPIPKFLLDKIMGKDNLSVIEMMYPQISKNTIKNVCKFIYHYKVPKNLTDFSNPVMFWRGSEEPIPAKSEKILRDYLPQMKTEVFEGMGHGQFLHEHSKEYAEKLKVFLGNK
ncbi:alpha/beta fold hydrolase [Anaerococcus degeneri]|uniref:Alpha/beta hydrolase n=1 Tax=Anaerococcus degeneri TaxID=361500 RepID=A0ABS7YUQ2_9FIRM|nr:alpha/beta hydrolase [Anaerococcus degeneri]MBP2015204.1 pimeloyl-ACP methyl ester carboxylesterase [Anaerococcus degeneri]MCA2095462.1 alpha/beta hydrolase [Anaerococcus degeneri]